MYWSRAAEAACHGENYEGRAGGTNVGRRRVVVCSVCTVAYLFSLRMSEHKYKVKRAHEQINRFPSDTKRQ